MYRAVVVRLKDVASHPSLHKGWVVGEALGRRVISDSIPEDSLAILFPQGGMFSMEFAEANSTSINLPKSSDVVLPLKSVAFTGISTEKLYEGFAFDTLNGFQICKPYLPPEKAKLMRKNIRKNNHNIMFPPNPSYGNFSNVSEDVLQPGALIHFTEKLNGTSQRVGHVLEQQEGFPKRQGFFSSKKRELLWKYLIGTRSLILNDVGSTGYYGSNDFRENVVAPWKELLNKGEVVYGEVVGWANGKPIATPLNVTTIPELAEVIGDTATFSYGIDPGLAEFYVYRIIQTNEDGDSVELPWSQVKARCLQLGVKHVPELHRPIHIPSDSIWSTQTVVEVINTVVEAYSGGESTLDDSHIREGLVIRAELADGRTLFAKNKSIVFSDLEAATTASLVEPEQPL